MVRLRIVFRNESQNKYFLCFNSLSIPEQQLTEIGIFATVKEIFKHFELKPITKVEDINLKHDLVLNTTEPIRVKFVSRIN